MHHIARIEIESVPSKLCQGIPRCFHTISNPTSVFLPLIMAKWTNHGGLARTDTQIFLICTYVLSAKAQISVGPNLEVDWHGLGPIQVQRPAIPFYVEAGAPTTTVEDGATITGASQSWVNPNTNDMGTQTITTTADGKAVTTTSVQHAEVVESTVTKDGKESVATSVVITPKLGAILDKVSETALSTCGKKRQACTLESIGAQRLSELIM